MERKSSISRNKESEQVYLALLNEHFKTVLLEKYNDAMLNLIFSDACDSVLGKNFAKKRISARKEKKLKEYIATKLRKKYGRWISFTNFKIKSPHNIQFRTNLDKMYTVPGHGKLFGANYHTACGNIFYTEHCLERFEERVDHKLYNFIMGNIKEVAGAYPTGVDVLSMMILSSRLEYGKVEGYYHVNITSGILVLEDFGNVFIAKTFLSPDMIKPTKWYLPLVGNVENMTSFSDVVKSPCDQIDAPDFSTNIMKEAQLTP